MAAANATGSLMQLALPAGVEFDDLTTWTWPLLVGWAVGIIVSFELLNVVCNALPLAVCSTLECIPVRGKHLDTFETIDYLYSGFNKLYLPVFVYQYAQFAWQVRSAQRRHVLLRRSRQLFALYQCTVSASHRTQLLSASLSVGAHCLQGCLYPTCVAQQSPRVLWRVDELGLLNTVGSVLAFFVVYDLFYSWFHRILHHKLLYRHIHKHHHRQMAPSRGTQDAINEHPIEYLVGEYLHLLAVYLATRLWPVHVAAVGLFITAAAVLASFNHERYAIADPLGLYDARYHDQHHVQPRCNYGSYIMLWDHVFGTFVPSPPLSSSKDGAGAASQQARCGQKAA